jgi:hypothetical protein
MIVINHIVAAPCSKKRGESTALSSRKDRWVTQWPEVFTALLIDSTLLNFDQL